MTRRATVACSVVIALASSALAVAACSRSGSGSGSRGGTGADSSAARPPDAAILTVPPAVAPPDDAATATAPAVDAAPDPDCVAACVRSRQMVAMSIEAIERDCARHCTGPVPTWSP